MLTKLLSFIETISNLKPDFVQYSYLNWYFSNAKTHSYTTMTVNWIYLQWYANTHTIYIFLYMVLRFVTIFTQYWQKFGK